MQPTANRVRMKLHVKAMSPQTRLISEPDKTLTLFVAAPPVKGKANREIVKWFAKRLGKSSSEIRIVTGLHSNSKTIEISHATKSEVAMLLQVDLEALTEA